MLYCSPSEVYIQHFDLTVDKYPFIYPDRERQAGTKCVLLRDNITAETRIGSSTFKPTV